MKHLRPESSILLKQELHACELAFAALDKDIKDHTVLNWFVTDVLGLPVRWAALVFMALLEKNCRGQLCWRQARSNPLALLKTIARRAAWRWNPAILFDDSDETGDRLTRSRHEQPYCKVKLDRSESSDGHTDPGSTRDERIAAIGAFWGEERGQPRGRCIRRSRFDDPSKADAIDSKLEELGYRREPMQAASGWSRDEEELTHEQMVEDALRFSLEEGKGRGREWLRASALSSGYSDRFIKTLIRRYNAKLTLLETELLCNAGPGESDYQDTRLYLGENEDSLVPSYIDEAVTRCACRAMGFTQEQTELMVLRGQGITRQQLIECPPSPWTAADVERVWRKINRRLADPNEKSEFRRQLHRAQDAAMNRLFQPSDDNQELTLVNVVEMNELCNPC